jgi:hypothetical protein
MNLDQVNRCLAEMISGVGVRYDLRLDTVTARATAGPLLVRPDGYVAWAGDGSLQDALRRRLGRPT